MEIIPAVFRLYYFLDPMCAWCWAFRPALRKIEEGLPDGVELIRVLGGLAPDTDDHQASGRAQGKRTSR